MYQNGHFFSQHSNSDFQKKIIPGASWCNGYAGCFHHCFCHSAKGPWIESAWRWRKNISCKRVINAVKSRKKPQKKIISLAGIWTHNLRGTKPKRYKLSTPGLNNRNGVGPRIKISRLKFFVNLLNLFLENLLEKKLDSLITFCNKFLTSIFKKFEKAKVKKLSKSQHDLKFLIVQILLVCFWNGSHDIPIQRGMDFTKIIIP